MKQGKRKVFFIKKTKTEDGKKRESKLLYSISRGGNS
jgi:hypothetical protein